MTTEENKTLGRLIYERVYNEGNLSLIDQVYDKNYVGYNPPSEFRGSESLKLFVLANQSAFPDLKFIVEDQIAEGDKVAIRWTGTGTHRGEFMGVVPTGKVVTSTGITVSRIASGKIVESWTNMDILGMMQQLGAIPLPK